jgi:uridylate kinase
VPSSANEVNDRFLIKLSGEAFGSRDQGIDTAALELVGRELLLAWHEHPRLAVVVGGGNFYRGRNANSAVISRVHADYVGMLATVMNGIILQQWIEAQGLASEVLSAFPVGSMCKSYSPVEASTLLDSGSIVILAGGIGSPFFSTDTTASLRALEIGAKTLIKATRVDGVFDCDPEKNHAAVKFDVLDFETVISKNLGIMDSTAFALCRDNDLAIRVLNIRVAGNLRRAVCGEDIGTLVSGRSVKHD